jgi:hypothetical protein
VWRGNVEKALDRIEECYFISIDDEIKYRDKKKLAKYLEEFQISIQNNSHIIINLASQGCLSL